MFRHSVTVLALEPERLDEVSRLMCDLAESTRARGRDVVLADGTPVADLRLLRGRHLRPGARYEFTDAGTTDRMTLVVREWRRGTAVAVEQLLSSEELVARLTLRLRSPDRPRLLEAVARMRGAAESGLMQRGSGRARLDLAAWWSAAALPPGAPPAARAPATARLKHLLADARLQLRPRLTADGRWRVEVTATVRGRWLLRPVAAVALLLAGGPLRREFRSGVERAAEVWDEVMGPLLALSPDELRAELARQAAEVTPADRRKAPEGP
nr:hypothetical protein OG461_14030 [Streptomyces sp. NBC_00995]